MVFKEYAGHKSPSFPIMSDGGQGKFAMKLNGFFTADATLLATFLRLFITVKSSSVPSCSSLLPVGRGLLADFKGVSALSKVLLCPLSVLKYAQQCRHL